MGKKFRGRTTSIGFLLFGSGAFLVLAMNYFVNDYKSLIAVIEVMCTMCIFFYLLMGESPFYYFKRKMISKLYYKLAQISDTNYPKI